MSHLLDSINKEFYPFIEAIIKDDPEELADLISNNPDIINKRIGFSISGIMFDKLANFACYFKAISCIDILENFGADFHSKWCIEAAVAGGSLDIIKRLNLNLSDFDMNNISRSPASIAAKFGNLELLKYIFSKVSLDIKRCYIGHPLYFAIKYCQLECAKFIIESTNASDIKIQIFESLCQAASALKADDSLQLLMKVYNHPARRDIAVKYIIACDSPHLYQQEYGLVIDDEKMKHLINCKSIRIIKFLKQNKVQLPRYDEIVTGKMRLGELKLEVLETDPDYYFKLSVDNNLSVPALMTAKLVHSIDSELGYEAIKKFNSNELIDIVYEKVDRNPTFINKFIPLMLRRGKHVLVRELGIIDLYTGDHKELVNSATKRNSFVFLQKNNIIKSGDIDANFIMEMDRTTATNESYINTLIDYMDDPADVATVLIAKEYYNSDVLRVMIKLNRVSQDPTFREAARNSYTIPAWLLAELKLGLCYSVKHLLTSATYAQLNDDMIKVFQFLSDKEKEELREDMDPKLYSAIRYSYVHDENFY